MDGGAGTASSITSGSVTYAGGGGGSKYAAGTQGAGGAGGGGAGQYQAVGTAGEANKGGGGGGSSGIQPGSNSTGGVGGKGVVILSMPDANYSTTITGSPTVAADAGGTGKTVLTFTGDGTYTT